MNMVSVKINGFEYILKGEESEEYLHKVACYVDKQIKSMIDNNNKLSTSSAAVLSAVNAADEMFKSKEECDNSNKKIDEIKDSEKKLNEQIQALNKRILYLEGLKTKQGHSELMEQINEKNKIVQEFKLKNVFLDESVKEYKTKKEEYEAQNKELKIQINSLKYKIIDLQNKILEDDFNIAKMKKLLEKPTKNK